MNDSTNCNTNQHTSVTHQISPPPTMPTIQGVAPKADVLGFAERMEIEFCQGSAIAPSLYRANVEIVEDHGLWEPNRALGQKVSRFYETQRPHSYGFMAMLNQETGDGWQGKPANPRGDRTTGKEIKYESVTGNGSRAYLPAIDVGTWLKIAERYKLTKELPSWVQDAVKAGLLNKKSYAPSLMGGVIPLPEREARTKPIGFMPSGTTSKANCATQSSEDIKCGQQDSQNFHTPMIMEVCCDLACKATQTETHQTKPSTEDGTEAATLSQSNHLENGLNSLGTTGYQGRSFWKWLEQHTEIPRLYTEGAKKSLSLLSLGYAAIALYGVNAGYRVTEKVEGEAVPLERAELIGDVARFTSDKTSAIIVFDEDTKEETQRKVAGAAFKFGALLRELGSKVEIARWDSSLGKGIDDVIAKSGAAYAENAIARAKAFKGKLKPYTAPTPLPVYELTYQANVTVTTRYLGAIAIPASAKLIVLKAPKGSGKTELMAAIAKGKAGRALVISHREQLGRQLSARFGVTYLADVKKGTTEGDGGAEGGGSGGLALCIDSLHPTSAAAIEAIDWIDCDVFIDEILSVLWQLLNSTTCIKSRIAIIREFQKLIKGVLAPSSKGRLIVADADIDDFVVRFLLNCAEQPELEPFVIRSDFKAEKGWDIVHYQGHADLYSSMTEAIASGTGKHFIACTGQKVSSKWGSQILERQLKQAFPGKRILRVDRESVVEPSHEAFGCIETLDETIKDYDIVITTPVIESGVSIDLHGHFEGVWIFASGVCPESGVRQFAARVRDANVTRHISAPQKGCNFAFIGNGEVRAQDLLLGQRRLTRQHLAQLRDSAIDIDSDGNTSYSAAALDAYGKLGARVNLGLSRYWESIAAAWLAEGHSIKEAGELDKDTRKAINAALGATRDETHTAECEAIASATPPDSLRAYEDLADKKIKTPDERRSQRAWEVKQKYLAEEVSADLVLKDDDGWHGLISLQYYLTVGAEFIKARDAARFDAIAPEKLDWWIPDANRKLLGAKVAALDVLGFTAILKAVQGGEVVHRQHELVVAFSKQLEAVSAEDLKLFAGLSISAEDPMSVLQEAFSSLLGFRLLRDGQKTLTDEHGKTKRLNLYVWPSQAAIARLEHEGKLPKRHPQDGRADVLERWLERDTQKAATETTESDLELKRSEYEKHTKTQKIYTNASSVQVEVTPPLDLAESDPALKRSDYEKHTKTQKIYTNASSVQNEATPPLDLAESIPDVSGWLSPESLRDIRWMHENIDLCPENRENLKTVPPHILKIAIAAFLGHELALE